jgi:tetratricopeptide (TPR) repeat protein
VVDGVGDVGLATLREYRRRGLDAVTTGAAVEYGFSSELSAIEWTCSETNIGSRRVAEKLGSERQQDYTLYYINRDEAAHLRAMAYSYLQKGDGAQAVAWLFRASAIHDDLPAFIYFDAARAWALAGDTGQALELLETAIDRGWGAADETEACADIASLSGSSKWRALLARTREGCWSLRL